MQKHSQLDLSLFKFLQRLLPLTRRESGGELGSLDSTKELHQQVESEEEKRQCDHAERVCGTICARNVLNRRRFLQPVCALSGVGEAEDGAELHAQDEVEDEERLLA